MSEFSVQDMIGSVLEKQPDQFRTAFNDVMVDKIAAALDIKKQEVAQNYFTTSEEETEQETEEENGENT